MSDSGFASFVIVVLFLVVLSWAVCSHQSNKEECESKHCPTGMAAKYMQTGEYSHECLCVQVPR